MTIPVAKLSDLINGSLAVLDIRALTSQTFQINKVIGSDRNKLYSKNDHQRSQQPVIRIDVVNDSLNGYHRLAPNQSVFNERIVSFTGSRQKTLTPQPWSRLQRQRRDHQHSCQSSLKAGRRYLAFISRKQGGTSGDYSLLCKPMPRSRQLVKSVKALLSKKIGKAKHSNVLFI